MNKLSAIRQICLIISFSFLVSCQNYEGINNDQDAHIVSFSFKGLDASLQSVLNKLTDFHLHITDMEGKTVSYKNFDNIESIPTIEIEQGNYQVLTVANAKPEIFKVPSSPLTPQSVISLQPTAANISELCLTNNPLTVTEDENNELELTLVRVVGKINIAVENVSEDTESIQVCINNMFSSVRMNSTYPGDVTTCSFNLSQDTETNLYSAQDIILFPTDGNVNITYTITDKKGKNKIYTQTFDNALEANGTLNITTSLSNIVRNITPRISLKEWDEPINISNTIIIGKDENNEEENNTDKIFFNGLPDNFTPTKVSIVCKNKSDELLPATETTVDSEIAINTPNGAFKLIKATFTNASNNSFSVYFGKTGTEGVYIQNAITIPQAPALGSYYAGGIIINQQGNEGYLAYKCTAISVDIWEKTKWGETFEIKSSSNNDAQINDNALTTFIKKTPEWGLKYFPAFKVCREYRGGSYDDWYFATVSDLTNAYSIYQQSPDSFNNLVSEYATTSPLIFDDGISYITSTESIKIPLNQCCGIKFPINGSSNLQITKGSTSHKVCAVRYL